MHGICISGPQQQKRVQIQKQKTPSPVAWNVRLRAAKAETKKTINEGNSIDTPSVTMLAPDVPALNLPMQSACITNKKRKFVRWIFDSGPLDKTSSTKKKRKTSILLPGFVRG
jgi:hypothetical protein